MGLDGGTIATRSDILRRQSRRVNEGDTSRSTRGGNAAGPIPEDAREAERRQAAWTSCPLSGEPLAHPLVADPLGTLYNKAAVVEFLLARKGKVRGRGPPRRHQPMPRLAAAAAARRPAPPPAARAPCRA
jgi:hypothetical protein